MSIPEESVETTELGIELPSLDALEEELSRSRYKKRYEKTLGSTLSILIVIAAIAVLTSMLWLPALQIYGTSMAPNVNSGEYVVAVKGSKFIRGDIVAFYYGNKILVKRFVAGPGEWVNIDDDGNVYVNNSLLNEPYVFEKAKGECDLMFPYQVPEERYFLLGDHRATSIDSRSNSVGCVSEEQIVGRVFFRIWPLNRIGKLS